MICTPSTDYIPQLKLLWKEAFGDTEKFIDSFFDTAFSPKRCRILTKDDMLGAMLFWFDCDLDGEKVAYLYAIATAKNMRGLGFCHQLMKSTQDELKTMGYSTAILVPSDDGLFKFYGGMGYIPFGYLKTLSVNASADAVKIEKITISEYANLRRKHLAKGAVIEEGVCLDFLSLQSSFYKGDDFVLAARIEGKKLVGIELLGNYKSIEGILKSLGCTHGEVRIQGGEKPFAMYLPLKESSEPEYFGLAFDI